MNHCKVRRCKQEDIGEIVELEKQIFSDAWSEKALDESLAQDHVYISVADQDGTVAGYVIFYTALDEGDIARIAVNPMMRRLGIGDALMQNLFAFCEDAQIKKVLLEVRESNGHAIALYEKHGFIAIGMRKGYYTEPLENGVIMEKCLDISASIL